MQLKKTLIVTTAVAAMTGASLVAAGTASADPVIAGTYNAVAPVRVLNTLTGKGAVKASVAAGKSLTFSVASALPSALVSAEVLTVQAYRPTRAGYLNIYPTGTAEPQTSTLNFPAGATTTTNEVYVGYGSSGSVTIHNVSPGSVNLVADLSGYWTGGAVDSAIAGAYNTLPTARVLDTRSTGGAIASKADRSVPVLGNVGVPDSGVSAVAVNVTVPAPTVGGHLTLTANATDEQGSGPTSDVSFGAGQSRADLVVVPVDPDTGDISIYNDALGAVGAVVDVVGYFNDGSQTEDGAFVPSTPYRSNDTRTGPAVGPGKTVTLNLGVGGDPMLFKAAVVNLTVVAGNKVGFITAWSGTGAVPGTSNVNFAAGQTVAVEAVTTLSSTGSISIYNGSNAAVNVVLDIHGFMLNNLSTDNAAVVRNRIAKALTNAHRTAAQRIAK